MSPPSLTYLYLAWRQAKTALYFERRGVGLVDLAQYEAELPVRLEELQALLSDGSWFDQLDVGEVWIVPKRLNGDCRVLKLWREPIQKLWRVAPAFD